MKILNLNIITEDNLEQRDVKNFSDGWFCCKGLVIDKLQKIKKLSNRIEDETLQIQILKLIGEIMES